MIILKLLYLLSVFLILIAGFSIGILGAFKIDILHILVPKMSLRYVQTSIGIATLFAIVYRLSNVIT